MADLARIELIVRASVNLVTLLILTPKASVSARKTSPVPPPIVAVRPFRVTDFRVGLSHAVFHIIPHLMSCCRCHNLYSYSPGNLLSIAVLFLWIKHTTKKIKVHKKVESISLIFYLKTLLRSNVNLILNTFSSVSLPLFFRTQKSSGRETLTDGDFLRIRCPLLGWRRLTHYCFLGESGVIRGHNL